MIQRLPSPCPADARVLPVYMLLRSTGKSMDAFGPGRDPHLWLTDHIGHDAQLRPYRSPDADMILVLRCNSVAAAAGFLHAFPEFSLAGGSGAAAFC